MKNILKNKRQQTVVQCGSLTIIDVLLYRLFENMKEDWPQMSVTHEAFAEKKRSSGVYKFSPGIFIKFLYKDYFIILSICQECYY